jgi:exodeoxyribonuclease VII small subunit
MPRLWRSIRTGPERGVIVFFSDNSGEDNMDKVMNENLAEAPDQLSVEEAFDQLEGLIKRMEEDGISLEESFACYEKGIRLLRQVNERIDRVEKKVQMLTEDGTLEAFE